MRDITRTHHGIYAYVEKNDKVMLIIKKRGPYTGLYDLPGGSKEQGETDEETLAREILEETGCTLVSSCGKQSIETYYIDFTEKTGEPGCLHHTAVVFNAEITGTPDDTISDLDSDGAFWLDKKILNKTNSTPFVLMCMNIYSTAH